MGRNDPTGYIFPKGYRMFKVLCIVRCNVIVAVLRMSPSSKELGDEESALSKDFKYDIVIWKYFFKVVLKYVATVLSWKFLWRSEKKFILLLLQFIHGLGACASKWHGCTYAGLVKSNFISKGLLIFLVDRILKYCLFFLLNIKLSLIHQRLGRIEKGRGECGRFGTDKEDFTEIISSLFATSRMTGALER